MASNEPEDTLLSYDIPIEVENPDMKDSFMQDPLEIKKKGQLPPMDQKPSIDDILNGLFPARKFMSSGRYFIQKISVVDGSRDDL